MTETIELRNSCKDFATWIGERYYTASSFIAEAKTIGVCRRIPFVPKGLRFGESRIFFISRAVGEAETLYKQVKHERDASEIKKFRSFRLNRKALKERGVELTPHVIGYGVVTGVLCVGSSPVADALARKGIDVFYLPPSKVNLVPLRGCGTLKVGGVYLVDSTTLNVLVESGALNAKGIEVSPSTFTAIDPPIPAPGLFRWRGLRAVNGDAILARKPWQEWLREE